MMQYKGYIAKVEHDPDAMIFHGSVVGIRDVVTFQSDTAKGLQREFQASVEDYIAFCRQRGESPDKPASGRFVARVDSELHQSLSAIAAGSNRSLNDVVAAFLAEGVQRELPTLAERSKSSPAKTRHATT